MDERAPDHWSAERDDLVRGALLSLRADVDATPLPEPEFVRARGDAQRRRLLLGATAGVAAAVIIVGALGFRGLAREDAAPPPLPATPTPTLTSTTPTPTTSPSPTASASLSRPTTPTASPTAPAIRTPRPAPTGTRAAPTPGPTRTGSRPTSTAAPRPSSSAPTTPTPADPPPPILTKGTPTIAASQFLTAAQWNAANTLGTTVESRIPAEAGVGAVTLCDPNAEATPAAMSWVGSKSGSSWWAAERIQSSNLQSDGATNAGEPEAIVRAMLADEACLSKNDPIVTLEAGPRPGTIAVTSTYPGGVGPTTDLVGAVALPDGTSTATFVLSNTAAGSAGWTFLGNLMDAAAKG